MGEQSKRIPDAWPRLMRADVAAAYLGESVSTFLERVKSGLYPKPVDEPDRRRMTRWDRQAIDRYVDSKTDRGGGFVDPDEAMERLNANREANARRRHR